MKLTYCMLILVVDPFFNNSYFSMGSFTLFQAPGIRSVEAESNRMNINNLNNNKKTTKEYFKNSDESDELCNGGIHFPYSKNNNNYGEIIMLIYK